MFHSRDVKYLREDVRVNAKIFLDLCKEAGLNVLITETVRDKAYQEYCVSQGWAAKTATVPTFHSVEAGLAFDICKNVKGHEYDDAEFFKKASAIGKRLALVGAETGKVLLIEPIFSGTTTKSIAVV